MKKLIIRLLSLVALCNPVAQAQSLRSPETEEAGRWVDSVFRTLTTEQKIGQLFMVDAYSNRDQKHIDYVSRLIREYHIGGVIFFQGGPVRQAVMTNHFQALSPVKLLIGIDGEWGLSMRLDSTIRFPRQMTLGATANDTLIYQMAREIGRQCRRMGIHLNFAPVADINDNPKNPVISSRSFGESRFDVARYARLYTRGLQDEGVLACGKHFPGHGNTDSDSHLTLPVLRQDSLAIDTLELFPFRELVNEGVASMMVAHLQIPSYDTTINLAATLSPRVVNGLLREKLKFKGLIFTDALNMKGVADFHQAGDLELKALIAGNDVLLFSTDVPVAWNRINLALQNSEISQEMIDEKVKRILLAKYQAGISSYTGIDTAGLLPDLNNADAEYLSMVLYEKSLTVLQNVDSVLPIRNDKNQKILSIVVNDTLNNCFQEMMGYHARMDKLRIPGREPSPALFDSIIGLASKYDLIIFSIHNTSTKAESGYGIPDRIDSLIRKISGRSLLVTVVFGNAYTLTRIPSASSGKALILGYEDTRWPQYFAGQLLFGAGMAEGKLPVNTGIGWTMGYGTVFKPEFSRLRFSSPREMGLPSSLFAKIDTIAFKLINDRAAPGCQVLVAYKGRIIHHKSYGSHTYENPRERVRNQTLYDIASITKIAGTALAVMRLYEKEEIDLDKRISKYLHELRRTNKRELTIEDILLHQAGLKSWIPFYKNTLVNGKPSFNIYHYERDVNYSIPVADSLFILNSYPEKIWKEIFDSPVENEGKYVYSDLGLLIMQKVVEKITEVSLDEYLDDEFYRPLGLSRLLYNPVARFPLTEIAPTEVDREFRQRKIHGYVHDPAAAMLGGVAGHAGLFGTAFDVAVIMQMLMNGGIYGGKRYFDEETVKLFTSRCDTRGTNRRGLIFDKPEISTAKNSNTALAASPSTFGHTGFTGTAAWADPENELIFIFLSNRVYPDSKINKLAQGNYRTDMMEAVYEALGIQKKQLSGSTP
jgi:beta-N-acetylhexosaminidase